jgi:hypothetical protein
MKIVCFKPMKTEDGKQAICGAVQMTGFNPGKHTMRNDRPCDGCGEANHYDGVGDDWNSVNAINGDVKPIREL